MSTVHWSHCTPDKCAYGHGEHCPVRLYPEHWAKLSAVTEDRVAKPVFSVMNDPDSRCGVLTVFDDGSIKCSCKDPDGRYPGGCKHITEWLDRDKKADPITLSLTPNQIRVMMDMIFGDDETTGPVKSLGTNYADISDVMRVHDQLVKSYAEDAKRRNPYV